MRLRRGEARACGGEAAVDQAKPQCEEAYAERRRWAGAPSLEKRKLLATDHPDLVRRLRLSVVHRVCDRRSSALWWVLHLRLHVRRLLIHRWLPSSVLWLLHHRWVTINRRALLELRWRPHWLLHLHLSVILRRRLIHRLLRRRSVHLRLRLRLIHGLLRLIHRLSRRRVGHRRRSSGSNRRVSQRCGRSRHRSWRDAALRSRRSAFGRLLWRWR